MTPPHRRPSDLHGDRLVGSATFARSIGDPAWLRCWGCHQEEQADFVKRAHVTLSASPLSLGLPHSTTLPLANPAAVRDLGGSHWRPLGSAFGPASSEASSPAFSPSLVHARRPETRSWREVVAVGNALAPGWPPFVGHKPAPRLSPEAKARNPMVQAGRRRAQLSPPSGSVARQRTLVAGAAAPPRPPPRAYGERLALLPATSVSNDACGPN
jgi:hypothetical protein